MKIVVDKREKVPFVFNGPRYSGLVVEVGLLTIGDYSLAGLTDKVAVERKSLPDLVACLGCERERFGRELQRAAALDAFIVVVEATWADLSGGNYRGRFDPYAATQSVCAFMARYGIPFVFTGGRAHAEGVTIGFLRQYLESARKRWGGIVKAHGSGDAA